MKCIVLSLHRCGTQSTAELLRRLGLRTVHWPARDRGADLQLRIADRETERGFVLDTIAPLIERYQGAADVPLPTLYRHLHTRYPRAKFVLLHRDPDQWARSVRKHIGGRDFTPFERVQYWSYFPSRPKRLAELSDADLAGMHIRHTAEVTAFFAGRGTRHLLSCDLSDVDCGARIGAFLGYANAPALPRFALDSWRDVVSRRLRLTLSRTRQRLGDAARNPPTPVC
jgi:hypothetical protein